MGRFETGSLVKDIFNVYRCTQAVCPAQSINFNFSLTSDFGLPTSGF